MRPKVSILITTCNRPHYFVQALQSAIGQTYRNMEIIICDDSQNEETEQIMKVLPLPSDISIKYFKNVHQLGLAANYQKCFNLASGMFINYLNDDDLFQPQKIEKMLPYFLNHQNISLVTSSRLTINAQGQIIHTQYKATMKLSAKNKIINGRELTKILLRSRTNYIGEPTTVLFKKDKLGEPFGVYCGKEAGCNHDVASWLNLLEKGDAVYLVEPLSYFRIHETQLQKNPEIKLKAIKDWEEHLKLWQQRHGKPPPA
ncbi:MAG: glycosyltransferase family 2 protein [Dethiobacteria bacterium]|jgi:glycosyltransferase involved in cell wall biosynthesis